MFKQTNKKAQKRQMQNKGNTQKSYNRTHLSPNVSIITVNWQTEFKNDPTIFCL